MSTKIHQLVDGQGRPLVVALTPGQAGDSPMLKPLLSAGGRPPAFDAVIYNGRSVIERSFNDHKQWRALATRYDKLAVVYRGGVVLLAITTWLRE
jgi:transposase